jgi:hypothetical protein
MMDTTFQEQMLHALFPNEVIQGLKTLRTIVSLKRAMSIALFHKTYAVTSKFDVASRELFPIWR